MTRRFVFREDFDGEFRLCPAQTRRLEPSMAGHHRIRLRRGQAISWSFKPIGPTSDTSAAMTEIADQMLSTALIVWIHGDDGDPCLPPNPCDANWLDVQLNDGVSSSSIAMLSNVLVELREIVCLLSETYSISRDHVYLASVGPGTAVALQLLLMQPEDFLGIALFNVEFAAMPTSIEADDRLTHRRAMLAASVQPASAIHEALSVGKLLHAVGMQIKTHFYFPGRLTLASLVRELVEWINHGRLTDYD